MKFAEGKEPWDALVNSGPSNGMSDTEKGGSTDRPTGRVAASLGAPPLSRGQSEAEPGSVNMEFSASDRTGPTRTPPQHPYISRPGREKIPTVIFLPCPPN